MEPADVPLDHEASKTTKRRSVYYRAIIPTLIAASFLVVFLLIVVDLRSSQRNLTVPCKKSLAVPEKSRSGLEIGLSAMGGFGSGAEGRTSYRSFADAADMGQGADGGGR